MNVLGAVLVAALVFAGIIGILVWFPGYEMSVEAQTWRAIAMCLAIGAVLALIVWTILHRGD